MTIALQAFSKSLAELHEHAEHASPDLFPDQVLRVVRRLISFDGAILGSFDKATPHGLRIFPAAVFNRQQTLPQEYAELSAADPIAQALRDGLREPMAIDCEELYESRGLTQLSAFARRHGIRKLLVYAETPTAERAAYGIALFRSAAPDFTAADVKLLRAIWDHIMQAYAINLKRALHCIDPHGTTRALALINSRGLIEVANAAMIELMKLEWPTSKTHTLPMNAIASLLNTGTFHGKQVEITASEKFGYLACIGRRTPMVNALSPSERSVADRYAKGMTHTEIASHLRVSPHTIRNQLAQVYQKLGVHSKAELVRMLSSRQHR